MVKKLLLAALLGGFFSGIGAEDCDVMEQLLQRVDLVLFLLERNTVRMERYNLNELQSDINFVSKDLASEHCVFELVMTEKNSKTRTVTWDKDRLDRVKILSGKKRAPKTYYLMLEKLVSPDVQLEDFSMVCFDCTVKKEKGMPKTKTDLKSIVNVMMPGCQQELTMQLVVDGKVNSACGLFVQRELFDNAPLCGKVKKQEALDLGILITQEAQEFKTIKKATEKTISSSLVGRITSGFTARLGVVARFFSTSWKKAWGHVC